MDEIPQTGHQFEKTQEFSNWEMVPSLLETEIKIPWFTATSTKYKGA